MRCLDDEQIRRGLVAVVQGYDRCRLCALALDDHDDEVHPFEGSDLLTLFIRAARDGAESLPPDPSTDPR